VVARRVLYHLSLDSSPVLRAFGFLLWLQCYLLSHTSSLGPVSPGWGPLPPKPLWNVVSLTSVTSVSALGFVCPGHMQRHQACSGGPCWTPASWAGFSPTQQVVSTHHCLSPYGGWQEMGGVKVYNLAAM
jgi:hypothetical protein